MLDCQGLCTPQGPDAKDCFPFLGGWALPARRKFQAPAAGEGVDPATTPCDHIPAAQTCGINSFLSLLLLSWQRYLPGAQRRGPQLFLFAQKRPLSSPSPFPPLLVRPRHSSEAGALWKDPHQGLAHPPTGCLLVWPVGRLRAGVLWDNGIFVWEFAATQSPLPLFLNPFPWL